MIMKKAETEMDDELHSEYDLQSLRVRKVGPKRKGRRMMADINKKEKLRTLKALAGQGESP